MELFEVPSDINFNLFQTVCLIPCSFESVLMRRVVVVQHMSAKLRQDTQDLYKLKFSKRTSSSIYTYFNLSCE